MIIHVRNFGKIESADIDLSDADQIAKAKILAGFDEGKVTIGAITYDYDVRTFADKKHHMYFNNGLLAQQTAD